MAIAPAQFTKKTYMQINLLSSDLCFHSNAKSTFPYKFLGKYVIWSRFLRVINCPFTAFDVVNIEIISLWLK